MNLWPIGNCEIAALVDPNARIAWGCLPRFDGDPVFCSLLEPRQDHGYWDIVLENCAHTEQHYIRNTPVLVTRMSCNAGNVIEVVDFMPRFPRHGRMFRPVAIARIVRVISGSPRISVRLRPAYAWGEGSPRLTSGSNHIRYILGEQVQRLTSNAPLGWIRDERMFRAERDLYFYFGPDEGFDAQLEATFANIDRVLAAGGSDRSRIVKVTIYLTDMANFPAIVEARRRYFTPPWPADTIVEVRALALPELMVEIDVIALAGER